MDFSIECGGNLPKDYAEFCKKKPRKISEKYLNLLHQKGRVAKPLSSSEIIEIIKNNGMSTTPKKRKRRNALFVR